MKIGRGIRLNLASHKGMNINDYVHATNESTKQINLRHTENGLEMRNGALTLNADISSKTLKNSEKFTATGEQMLYRNGSIVFTGYYPFGTLDPTLGDNIFETTYKNVYAISKKDSTKKDQNIIGTLLPNMKILFRKSSAPTANSTDQSMSLYDWSVDYRQVMNCMLAERDKYYDGSSEYSAGTNNFDKYLTVYPASIAPSSSTDFNMYEKKGLYFFNGGQKVKADKKSLAVADLSTAANNVVGKSSSEFAYPSARYVRTTGTTSIYDMTLATTEANMRCFYHSGADSTTAIAAIALKGYEKLAIIKNLSAASTELYLAAIGDVVASATTIVDVAPVHYGAGNRAGLLVLSGNGSTYSVDLVIFNTSSPTTWTKVSTTNILSGIATATGISCERHIISSSNDYRDTVFAVYNTTSIDLYTASYEYNSSDAAFRLGSVTKYYTVLAADCYLSNGNIVDVQFDIGSTMTEMNRQLPVGIRPFFGYTSDTDSITMSEFDIYNIPVLENYEVPIDKDSCQKLNTTIVGSSLRWKHWQLYVITPPPTESGVKSLKLAKGFSDTAGTYRLKAWAVEGSATAGWVSKAFPAVFGPDNVADYSAGFVTDVAKFSDYTSYAYTNYSNTGTYGVATNEAKLRSETGGDNLSASALKFTCNNFPTESYGVSPFTFNFEKNTRKDVTYKYKLQYQYLSNTASTQVRHIVTSAEGAVVNSFINPSINTANKWYQFEGGFNVPDTYKTNTITSAFEFGFQPSIPAASTTATLYVADVYCYEWNDGKDDLFRNDIAFRTTEQEQFTMTYIVFGYFTALLDSRSAAVYFTAPGTMFVNRNQAKYFPSAPTSIAETGFGYVLSTVDQCFLLQGFTIPMPTINLLNYGVNQSDMYGVAGCRGFGVVYNDQSCWLVFNDHVEDIGVKLQFYLNEFSGNKCAAIDTTNNEVIIPIGIDAVGTVSITTSAGSTIYNDCGYAIYNVDKKAWRIYGYQANSHAGTFSGVVFSSPEVKAIVGDTGQRLAVLEQVDTDAAGAGLTWLNETWDIPIVVYGTRDASLENPGQMKKVRWLTSDNLTKRDTSDSRPFDTVRITVYTQYNPIQPTQNIVYQNTLYNTQNYSWSVPMDVNLYSAAFELVMVRTTDSYNPKVILKDLLIRVIDKVIKREGGW